MHSSSDKEIMVERNRLKQEQSRLKKIRQNVDSLMEEANRRIRELQAEVRIPVILRTPLRLIRQHVTLFRRAVQETSKELEDLALRGDVKSSIDSHGKPFLRQIQHVSVLTRN